MSIRSQIKSLSEKFNKAVSPLLEYDLGTSLAVGPVLFAIATAEAFAAPVIALPVAAAAMVAGTGIMLHALCRPDR